MITAAVRYRYVVEDVDRHGTVRLYFRRHGRKTRMPGPIGSPEFVAAYAALLEGSEHPPPNRQLAHPEAPHGTLRQLADAFERSAEFRALDPATRRTRQLIHDSMLAEPIAPGSDRLFGDMPVHLVNRRAVKVLRDRKAATPWAAQRRVKCLSRLFAWAIDDERPGIAANPAARLKPITPTTAGHHTWTDAEVERFEARWPVGTKQRLALDLLLYTGARRSCASMLGRQHEREHGTRLSWTAWKGRRKSPQTIDIPLLPPLRASIEATPTGDLAYLVTERGTPFSIAGFGMWFRAQCDAAGLPHCSAHGLRKAGSTRAAQNGATAHELMATYGWKRLSEAETYTRAAERRTLATSGANKILSHPAALKLSHQPTTLKTRAKIKPWRSLRDRGGR
jgi:integrase